MAVLARRFLPGDPAVAWSVLSAISRWPSWVDSIDRVEPVFGTKTERATAFIVVQPPLPSREWTITDWQEARRFGWESENPAGCVSEQFSVEPREGGSTVSIEATWSGRAAWFGRAAYGPVRHRLAAAQLEALADVCADGADSTQPSDGPG